MAAAHDVPAQFATNMTAITDREAAFADVNPFMSRVHGVAKASGASAGQLADHLFVFSARPQWSRERLSSEVASSNEDEAINHGRFC